MKTEQLKRQVTPITDPREIESIERDEPGDILGAKDANGNYWAYSFSVERWRLRSREEAKP